MKKINTIIATIVLLFAINSASLAQSIDKNKLDEYFDVLEKNDKFMGTVALSMNGEIIYTKSIGFASREEKARLNDSSKFRIGSISKTFTAVLVFKAVEIGRLSLDQTIESFFPTIPQAGKISIAYLLQHRSGLHNFTDDSTYTEWNTRFKSEAEMIDIIAKGGSEFEPGSKGSYSNPNYLLLTYILEKTFRKKYPELLKEYITGPLGLKNTFYGTKILLKNNECFSYVSDGTWKKESETDMSIPGGAGAIVSTAIDLVRFSDALFGGKLLTAESLEKMKTIKDGYGMGLFKYPFDGKASFGHMGGIDGFTSSFSHFADGNISYAMLSNGSAYNNNNISLTVLKAVFGKPFNIPVFKSFDVTDQDLDQYLGIYSTTVMPLKITISKDDGKLVAQATGQTSFSLESTDKHIFTFEPGDVTLVFKPEENKMILKQGGREAVFTRD